MIQIERSYTVRRSIEDVFAFLSNPESDVLWQNAIKAVRLTSEGPVRAGTTYEITFSFLGRKMTFHSEACVCEPFHAYAYRSLSGPFSYAGRFRFEPAPAGTQVHFTAEIETEGFFGIVPEVLLSKTFDKQVDADIATLQKLLEATQPHGVNA